MRPTIALLFALAAPAQEGGAAPGDYPIQPVPFTAVAFDDAFWLPRLRTNREVSIPFALDKCEETGRIENFAVAGGVREGEHQGLYFNDSDLAKVLEGVAYSLAIHPDPKLEARADGIIELIAAAQEEDGYLYTARTAQTPDKLPPGGEERWSNIEHGHELYCSGHMIEGAIAYFLATDKRQWLDVMIKNVGLLDRVFGPDGRRNPPGHQEIEIALGKLYRLTGEQRYLDLARFFLDERGRPEGHRLYGRYSQDHVPVVEQEEAVGHSVRAAYLYSGMADIAALTGDRGYVDAIGRIWEDVASTKLYVTGGIGASGGNEGFGEPFRLPNSSAYSETCASIANAMWNHRMFLLHGDGRYLDVLERVIYNACLSGISLRGDRFFYPNRLESFQGAERAAWFGCACCPSNAVRFLPSIPGYAYAHSGGDVFVNLYVGGTATVGTAEGDVRITQTTRYPWDGRIEIRVEPAGGPRSFGLKLRIPGWAREEAVPSGLYRFASPSGEGPTLMLNGAVLPCEPKDGFIRIERRWEASDRVILNLPMPIRRVLADPRVEDDLGRLALQRGPIVYCVEGIDTASGHARNLLLPDEAELETSFRGEFLGGVQVVEGTAQSVKWSDDGRSLVLEPQRFTAIPYYAWAHRARTEMSVWLAREAEHAHPLPWPSIAHTAKLTVSFGPRKDAMRDQMEPRSSIDHSVPFWHWWPQKDREEWAQFDFAEPTLVSGVEVYWLDDEGIGGCRPPASWRLLHLGSDGEWAPVDTDDAFGVEKDRYNEVSFAPVEARGLRLVMQSQEDWSGGIHEVRIHAQEPAPFDRIFRDQTLRIDFFQTGDAGSLDFSVDQLRLEGPWAGNPHRLIDDTGSGMYFLEIRDPYADRLLYSRGFATIFGEYRTTMEAKSGLKGTFPQSLLLPCPREPVKLTIAGRGEHNALVTLFEAHIDPLSADVIQEAPHRDLRVREIAVEGVPRAQADIALLAEGYTAEEEEKFWRDAERYAALILTHEPFGRLRSRISIRAVFLPSSESGVDQPRRGIFRNTAVDAAFNALDLERYLLIDDNRALRDIAGAVPYDIVAVLANSERYGGGGIYNDYCISTVDDERSEQVFMHEFGHAFGNLADEYFDAEVAYNEFFPPGAEPHEPNITALLDPQKVKWRHLLSPGIPVPTPWGQEETAALKAEAAAAEEEMRARVRGLEEQGGSAARIRELRDACRDRIDELDRRAEEVRRRYQDLYRGQVGVFEGAGYSPEGLYRSEVHVGMLHEGSFGPVSEEALARMIEHLTATDRQP